MNERMAILLNANVISQYSHDAIINIAAILAEEWSVDGSGEQIQMAMTHFARAIDRIRTEAPIAEGLDDEILNEIITDELFPQIEAMNSRLCLAAGLVDVPATENSFLLSNLYSIKLSA